VEHGRYASPRGGAGAPPARGAADPATAAPATAPGSTNRFAALRSYWLAPQGRVMLTATALALALRLYLLSRPGYLAGITEYDDGVYLGGAVSLLSGGLPYHDFAFVQPPGILLLMAPAALIAKLSGVTAAMAAARLLTVGASAACVTLTGSLVRHRGPLVTLVACGVLAVYPDDIMSAHTLLLEPWMNLLVLSGARLAFRNGRLAPSRLLWAGVAFGVAGSVKYWAVIPALILLVACWRGQGRGRAGRLALGTAAGFCVPVLPFALTAPGGFLRSTLLDQASRAGSAVPLPLRLAHLTGLADLLDDAGRLTMSGAPGSLFARGDVTATATWATSWLPVLVAVVIAALLGAGFTASRRGAEPLAWYALATLGGTLLAVLGYSAFFYHYADFAAPWVAITVGYAVPGCARLTRRVGRPAGRSAPGGGSPRSVCAARALPAAAAALLLVAGFQAWELSGLSAADGRPDAALIPPGACLLTDEISLAIAASRFTAGRGDCPDVLDSLAVTLVADNGISVQGGAAMIPRAAATWKALLSRARYVWLSGTSGRRIPWTPALRAWFGRTFRPLSTPPGQRGQGRVYARRG
jgi:hypothetical protein